MPIIAGLVIGLINFAFAVACNGRFGNGTRGPVYLAFAPLLHVAETFKEPAIAFYGGPFLYAFYTGVLWHALRAGWGRRALIELVILHYVCFGLLVPLLLNDQPFVDQLKNNRINLWLLGAATIFFVYVQFIAFRFATGRGVRRWLPSARFSLRTMLAGVLLSASGAALWSNRDSWTVQATFKGHKTQPAFAAFTRDGKRVISVDRYDGTTRIWEAESGRQLSSRKSHDAKEQKFLTTSNGPMVAIIGEDSIQPPETPVEFEKEFATALQTQIHMIFTDVPLTEAIAFIRNRSGLKIEFSDNAKNWAKVEITMLTPNMDAKAALEAVAKKAGVCVEYDKSSALIKSMQESTKRCSLRIWNLESDELTASLYMPHANRFFITDDGNRALTWRPESDVWFWNVSKGQVLSRFPRDKWKLNSDAVFSPDNSMASILAIDAKEFAWRVIIIDVSSGSILKNEGAEETDQYGGRPAVLWSKAGGPQFSKDWVFPLPPDGKRYISLNSLGFKQYLTLHEIESGQELSKFEVISQTCSTFADGNRILLGDLGPTIADIPTGRTLMHLRGKGSYTLWESVRDYFEFRPVAPAGGFLNLGTSVISPQISNDNELILTSSFDLSSQAFNALQVWRRHRPEWWWGYAWLPEFWVCTALACAFGWSWYRDFREMRDNVQTARK